MLMNCLTSLMVWVWLNFATSLVPSARRICRDVTGLLSSRGTEGGGAALASELLDEPADEAEWETTSGA